MFQQAHDLHHGPNFCIYHKSCTRKRVVALENLPTQNGVVYPLQLWSVFRIKKSVANNHRRH
jgi:hypothetical protein